MRSALSSKLAEQKLTVVDEWTLETHKTKALRQTLTRLDGASRTILMVETMPADNLTKASRNLAGVKLVTTTMLQPYDLLRHDRLLLTRAAAEKLSRGLSSAKTKMVEIQPAPKTKDRAKD